MSPTHPEDKPSSPIQSSPQKPPPTGRDGLMRSRAGGNAGFEPENASELETTELIRRLRKAADIIEAQQDRRFIENAKHVSKRVSDWVADIERHESRRTMPTTNTASSTSTIGYKYTSMRLPHVIASGSFAAIRSLPPYLPHIRLTVLPVPEHPAPLHPF
ncbi:hypothetical protein LXA43DRAFT_1102607 [Ganoderma leucocontextum]|nr:hypothetical protein LXA43DRAFT_1102607 [Ganoderma leucocontextum]